MVIERGGKKILFSHRPQPIGTWDINIHGHFHNNNHRPFEVEENHVYLTRNHILLAIENNDYDLWNLDEMLKIKFKGGEIL